MSTPYPYPNDQIEQEIQWNIAGETNLIQITKGNQILVNGDWVRLHQAESQSECSAPPFSICEDLPLSPVD